MNVDTNVFIHFKGEIPIKLKNFERVFNIDNVFNSIKTRIQTQFNLTIDDESSRIDPDRNNLTIIGVNLKENVIIIRIGLDHTIERTYLSIVVIPQEALKLEGDDKESPEYAKAVGKHLFEIVKRVSQGTPMIDFASIFMELGIKGIKKLYGKHKLSKTEKEVINSVIEVFYELGYIEKLFPFPFSTTDMEGEVGLWSDIYRPYLSSIENRLSSDPELASEKYYNCDFSKPNEEVDRIFDLVVLNEKALTSMVGDNKQLDITFVYGNKTVQPLDIRKIVMLSEEVASYANQFRLKFHEDYNVVKPHLIFLSLFGYTDNVAKYLREHLYREKEDIIPIFIVPPCKVEKERALKIPKLGLKKEDPGKDLIWNNFKEIDFKLKDKFSKATKSIQKTMTLGVLKKVKSDLKELTDKEAQSVLDDAFLEKWHHVLQIDISEDLIGAEQVKKKIRDAIANYQQETIIA